MKGWLSRQLNNAHKTVQSLPPWMREEPKMKLTFGDLQIGDYFIGFPLDGDNAGHGGYLGKHNVFKKLAEPNAAIMLATKTISHMPNSMFVLRVDL